MTVGIAGAENSETSNSEKKTPARRIGKAPDWKLQDQLCRKLVGEPGSQNDSVNPLVVEVKDGVATVGGVVHSRAAREAAVAAAGREPGVKRVVDNVQVLPLSSNDDWLKLQVARRIYSNLALRKYALDAAHPIRIIAENGRITLEGVVANSMERTLAGLAASTAPGVSSVKNNLEISERQ